MNRPETLAPEVVQRQAVARQHNQRCAELRILDREFYRSFRKFIRIPTNKAEAARNERLKALNAGLRLLATMPSMRRAVRASLGLHS